MSRNPDDIRREIAERRASLRANLDQLEERVRQSAALPLQVRDRFFARPLAPFGAAVLTGLLLGRLGRPRRDQTVTYRDSGGWFRMALVALFVDLLYDAARTMLPQLRSLIKQNSTPSVSEMSKPGLIPVELKPEATGQDGANPALSKAPTEEEMHDRRSATDINRLAG